MTVLADFKKVADEERPAATKNLLKGTTSLARASLLVRSRTGHLTDARGLRSAASDGNRPVRCAAYQTEIDKLTKRSKFAESSFLDAYKLLADAPDPAPMLAAAIVGSAHLGAPELHDPAKARAHGRDGALAP